ncbi:hypothetical protein [Inquilinus limosus]|uniref:Uncharacterized protein n=1 Tax=Inquilinus limosus TaxID=171674 RepID=A0A211ZLK7_9PROT|nr:hypothetical protein [Inquilinus limosus]OWJ66165.1 hypothetical protein BWR60_16375 [Inquilinus limosus]
MKHDPSTFPTDELVKQIQILGKDDADFAYEAERLLFTRWGRGEDLRPLIDLLTSERSSDRILGAYYLDEIDGNVEDLKTPVMRLLDDPIPDCRRVFVLYMSRYYGEEIGKGFAKLLLDINLCVRVTVIEWGIRTSARRFEHFSRLVEAGAGRRESAFLNPLDQDYWDESELKRGIRGLNIIRRVRAGEEISQIRDEIPEEDNFVFDSIEFLRTFRKRYEKWKETERRKTDS